jgi:hypothetical protein
MFAISDQPDTPKLPYWLNVLIAIDQPGNAIAGERLEKPQSRKAWRPCQQVCLRPKHDLNLFSPLLKSSTKSYAHAKPTGIYSWIGVKRIN